MEDGVRAGWFVWVESLTLLRLRLKTILRYFRLIKANSALSRQG